MKRSYRDRLASALSDLRIVHLSGSRSLVAERMAGRSDHFMPASLIDSQFALLEAPDGPDVLTIDIVRPVTDIVDAAEAFASHVRPTA